MYYTIYKITNKLNNKFYIGKHQTQNLEDGYMGSGILIKRAIEKYGIENFSKEILFVFDNEEEMNQKEKELVIISENCYNLCDGGKGGFGYIHKNKLKDYFNNSKISGFKFFTKEQRREYCSKGAQAKNKLLQEGKIDKLKYGLANIGTCWINDSIKNIKIDKKDLALFLKQGYSKGMIRQGYQSSN